MRPRTTYRSMLLALLSLPALACGGLGATGQPPSARPTLAVTRVIDAVLTAIPPVEDAGGQRTSLFPTPTPNPLTATLVQTGRLWCEDCAAAGMNVNLWSSYDRTAAQVVGSLPDRTPVTVLESKRNNAEARMYYRVQAQGFSGWVPETLIRLN